MYNPELMLQSSRGCPYSCSFCIETMYHDIHKGLGKFVRRRTVDNTIKEIQWHFNKKDNNKKYVFLLMKFLVPMLLGLMNFQFDIKKK